MAHTRTWNAAYEASPPNAEGATLGATRIREIKLDVKERLALDHVMNESNNDGYHNWATLIEQTANPANIANTGRIYSKDVSGITELFYIDSAGTVLQITSAGKPLLLATNNAWTKGQAITEVLITYAATITPNASLSNAFYCTLTGNVILAPPSNPKSGQVLTIRFIQDGTGGRTLSFGATIYGNAGNDWVLSTGASDMDILTLYYQAVTARWHAISLVRDINNAL